MPQLDFPDQISHTPVFLIPYFKHDPDRESNTDAQFLSVGWSQWNDNEVSAKVVRYAKSGRWSRQSEELPVSRLVDLTILTALAYGRGAEFTTLDGGMLQNQKAPIDVAFGSKRHRQWLADTLRDDKTLRKRLSKLHQVLNEIAAKGLL
ncbi:MAG TPA: DUF6530 family protein [Allosphingosinicella sp.]